MIDEDKVKELASKAKMKLKKEFDDKEKTLASPIKTDKLPKAPTTQDYNEFKKSYLPKAMTWYESGCKFAGNILKLKATGKDAKIIQESIDSCHLDVTPSGVLSLAILLPFSIFFFGALFLGAIIPSILGQGILSFFVIFFAFAGLIIYMPLKQTPIFLANNWRMKASSQMVLCIFYVVTYMRHTSNLELAVEFASQHLDAPMNLDLRKVLWDVETEKFSNIRDSLDSYLKRWRKDNLEFVEAFHLIEGSLFEGDEARRLSMLDKSLSVILEETYEKMLHYSQNLQQPITMLNMLGIILPILGLVILPLVVSFMPQIRWYHISTLYNVFLPILVYYLSKTIMASRPSGYGETDLSKNPELRKLQGINVFGINFKASTIAILTSMIFLFVGLMPMVIHLFDPQVDVIIGDSSMKPTVVNGFDYKAKYSLLDYKCPAGQTECTIDQRLGPFGLGATLLSICITLAFGLSLGLYYKLRSTNVMKVRDEAKKLEKEFASALFQLGNRLGDGFPAEMAFGKVAENMEGTISGDFFNLVSNNIKRLGMSVEQAIFDEKSGAITRYPSSLIESSMKVMTESVKKGPKIAAQALINISQYIKEMHRVNERLKDLMAENLSSIKGQIKFLTPSIAGIVIGITSMVTSILSKLTNQITKINAESGGGASTGLGIAEMFKTPNVPTYFFQVIVGLYVVQIIYILSTLASGIENGSDKLAERYTLGQNMTNSTLLYAMISFVVILLFNIVASMILV